jgi:hypothetical protein
MSSFGNYNPTEQVTNQLEGHFIVFGSLWLRMFQDIMTDSLDSSLQVNRKVGERMQAMGGGSGGATFQ